MMEVRQGPIVCAFAASCMISMAQYGLPISSNRHWAQRRHGAPQHMGAPCVAARKPRRNCRRDAHAQAASMPKPQAGAFSAVPWAVLAAGSAAGISNVMPVGVYSVASITSATLQPMLYATTLLYLGWVIAMTACPSSAAMPFPRLTTACMCTASQLRHGSS